MQGKDDSFAEGRKRKIVVSPEDLQDGLRHRATDMHAVHMLETN